MKLLLFSSNELLSRAIYLRTPTHTANISNSLQRSGYI